MGNQITQSREKRGNERYQSSVEVSYFFSYEIDTKVKYTEALVEPKAAASHKFTGVSKNVSVDGLCLVTDRQLHQGDLLDLEVYLPKVKDPTRLKGEVRWSQRIESADELHKKYDTGVKIITVEGKPVRETIYFDREYNVEWSQVLESILGKYRLFTHRQEKKS